MERLPDVMSQLRAGVPLTLLVDLFYAGGPHSRDIAAREPWDAAWVTPVVARIGQTVSGAASS